jgi:hypothetical protein
MKWKTCSRDFWTYYRAALNPDGKRRVDAYFAWGEATDYADLSGPPPEWFPVVIEVPDKAGTAASFCAMVVRRKWQHFIRVPTMYANPIKVLAQARFLTAMVTRGFLEEVAKGGELSAAVERFELGLPVVTADDVRKPPAEPPVPDQFARPATKRRAKVIVGVIDDGIAFAHERFREPGGRTTRIDHFWNQDGEPNGGPGYGIEYSKAQIDALLASSTEAGIVNEDRVYRRACYADVARRLEHGTHVADFACGEDPRTVTADAPRILAVQLKVPGRLTRGTCGLWLTIHALDALRYIVDRASHFVDANGEQARIVVNLSFGYFAGPHDGSSMLEMAIDDVISLHGRLAVVIPGGNSYLLRSHANFDVPPKGKRELAWRLLPDDATPSFVEIWPNDVDAELEIEVSTPEGLSSGRVAAGSVRRLMHGEDVLATIIFPKHVTNGARSMILVALAPTSSEPDRATASAGLWTINVQNKGKDSCKVDAWIQRDDTPPGFPTRGRQSRFEDPAYIRFDKRGMLVELDTSDQGYVKREGTLNSLATGKQTIIVGGTRGNDGRPAAYSSGGSIVNPRKGKVAPRAEPDVVTVSDDSSANQGRIGAGSRSGSAAALNGTSVAAPQVTRLIADVMPRHEISSRDEVVFKLVQEKRRRAKPPELVPDPERRPPQAPGVQPTPRGPRGGRGRTTTNQ